jgi:hypothetical protein
VLILVPQPVVAISAVDVTYIESSGTPSRARWVRVLELFGVQAAIMKNQIKSGVIRITSG